MRENRRFFLIDAEGKMINGKRLGSLQGEGVVADYSDAARTLALRFPDEKVLSGAVEPGERLDVRSSRRGYARARCSGRGRRRSRRTSGSSFGSSRARTNGARSTAVRTVRCIGTSRARSTG